MLTLVLLLIPQRYEFSSKSQLITTLRVVYIVVADTTKVRIFKQITTVVWFLILGCKLLLIPQRYEFSSKSQQTGVNSLLQRSCCWYHKGTNFQANHNSEDDRSFYDAVVADTTKVRIFKQITTIFAVLFKINSCCWYHKGTNFQANHNRHRYECYLR